jgi:hypothetical protein
MPSRRGQADIESTWVALRAEALTDRTATHRLASPVIDPSELGSKPESWLDRTATHRNTSPVSDPSELGSKPDSWLEDRYLRTRKLIQIVRTRVSRDWGSRSAVRR